MARSHEPVVTGSDPQPTTVRPPSHSTKHPPPFTATGEFRLWRIGDVDDSRWSLRCLLGDERPKVVRGFGGWGQTERQGRRSLANFDGSETPAMSIDLLLESHRVRRFTADEKLATLERLCGWDRTNDDPPPDVRWIGNVRHDYTHSPRKTWVVESLDIGDSGSDDGGTLLWVKATIVVAVKVDDELKVREAKGFRRAKLHKGHTLRQFARRELGDPKRWRGVADLNRDNRRCPQGPEAKAHRDVILLVPPKG